MASYRSQTGISARSGEILAHVVDAYLDTGEPVGSKTLAQRMGLTLSSATIRNVLMELEGRGLLYAPHTSAGRLPTEAGLRYFVHGLLEYGQVAPDAAAAIGDTCRLSGKSYEQALAEVGGVLSGLAHCAGFVLAPKEDEPIRQVEFVGLSGDKALVVLVLENGVVENRIIETLPGTTSAQLREASLILSDRLVGKTLDQVEQLLAQEVQEYRDNLDVLIGRLLQAGLAVWGGDTPKQSLIVRGQAHLLEEAAFAGDTEKVRQLFAALETRQTLAQLLTATRAAQGVQIFIGADNELFGIAGCSAIVAPFRNTTDKIVGAIGVIGSARLNYAHVIPMVDFTAKMLTRRLGGKETGSFKSTAQGG